MFTRRNLIKMGGLAAASAGMPLGARALNSPDFALEIAGYPLQISAKHTIRTIAYNQQIPGPLLRFREGRPVTIDVTNHSGSEEVVHWHGLFLPSDVDGAMEEGTPTIPPAGMARYTFTPRPSGFRWYHTHVAAGNDLKKGQYSGLHGFLMIEGQENAGRYDREFFLALHDWDGQMLASGDGSMNPDYRFSTINGKVLGYSEPLRVKTGERVLLHILNSSATEPHWIALAGHQFRVVAMDGNPVPQPQLVPMLRLAPAERICAVVEMNTPGVWVLGEVRKHLQASGMGVVVEYADSGGKPVWQQPQSLIWNYQQFAAVAAAAEKSEVVEIPLVFASKFAGHGALDRWTINGKSFPDTETVTLARGRRYRLKFVNRSTDDHPVHLHRHSFELRRLPGTGEIGGIVKDVVLVEGGKQVEVEFTAEHPGATLFHCHQQDHMDAGFMMLFQYV